MVRCAQSAAMGPTGAASAKPTMRPLTKMLTTSGYAGGPASAGIVVEGKDGGGLRRGGACPRPLETSVYRMLPKRRSIRLSDEVYAASGQAFSVTIDVARRDPVFADTAFGLECVELLESICGGSGSACYA